MSFCSTNCCGHESFKWHSTGYSRATQNWRKEIQSRDDGFWGDNASSSRHRAIRTWISTLDRMWKRWCFSHSIHHIVGGTDIKQCFVYNSIVRVLGGQTMDGVTAWNPHNIIAKYQATDNKFPDNLIKEIISNNSTASYRLFVATRRFTHSFMVSISYLQDHRSQIIGSFGHLAVNQSINQWVFQNTGSLEAVVNK